MTKLIDEKKRTTIHEYQMNIIRAVLKRENAKIKE